MQNPEIDVAILKRKFIISTWSAGDVDDIPSFSDMIENMESEEDEDFN